MTGLPRGAAPGTLRGAIRAGLIRVADEQRSADRVEDLDRMAEGVLVEMKRHQQAHPRRRAVAAGPGPQQEKPLQSLAAGLDVPQIAEQLNQDREQVADDVQHLYGLLGVKDPLGAVVAGYERGIPLPGRSASR